MPGSTEDDIISDDTMGATSPITELESLFQSQFDCEMHPLNRESVGVPCVSRAATNDAEAAEQLLHGIEDLSHWEPTPSIHSNARSDRPPPTSHNAFGLWYNSSESMERHEDEDNTLYKECGRVQGSQVRENEDKYGRKLLEHFIRISTWASPAQLGRQINRLVRSPSLNWVVKLTKLRFFKFRAHGGERDWEQYLSEEVNHKEVQDIRRKWRESHWRARNPDADEDPPRHKWFTFGQEAIDPAKVRASPPEVSDDELDELYLSRSRPKSRDHRAKKRKSAARSCTKTANTRQDGVLAPLSPPSSSSSSRGSKEDSSDSDWQENATQGRRKRRRFD